MCVNLKPNLLSTHVGGVITTKSDFYGAYPIFYKVVLMVDKKHKIQTKLAIYTCVKC